MKKGITLIELLIYLALVSGMLVSFIYYTISVTSSAESLNKSSNAVEEVRTILNLISAKIRTASLVSVPLSGQTTNTLELEFGPTDSLTFEMLNGVMMIRDQLNNSWPLNTAELIISNVTFERLDTNSPAKINISLNVAGINWQTTVNQKITP